MILSGVNLYAKEVECAGIPAHSGTAGGDITSGHFNLSVYIHGVFPGLLYPEITVLVTDYLVLQLLALSLDKIPVLRFQGRYGSGTGP